MIQNVIKTTKFHISRGELGRGALDGKPVIILSLTSDTGTTQDWAIPIAVAEELARRLVTNSQLVRASYGEVDYGGIVEATQ